MNKFVRKNFTFGEYAMYNGKFVARFKYGGRREFLKFLVSNFSVEEYFGMLNAGMAPLHILGTKGYVSPNKRKAMMQQAMLSGSV